MIDLSDCEFGNCTRDRFRLDDAAGCPHSELVRLALATGDWGAVDALPEPDDRAE